MSKIILKGHIVVPDNYLSIIAAELPTHVKLARKEHGCVLFDVRQDTESKNIFHIHQEFVDRAAFDRHRARINSSVWGQLSQMIERHYQISEA